MNQPTFTPTVNKDITFFLGQIAIGGLIAKPIRTQIHKQRLLLVWIIDCCWTQLMKKNP